MLAWWAISKHLLERSDHGVHGTEEALAACRRGRSRGGERQGWWLAAHPQRRLALSHVRAGCTAAGGCNAARAAGLAMVGKKGGGGARLLGPRPGLRRPASRRTSQALLLVHEELNLGQRQRALHAEAEGQKLAGLGESRRGAAPPWRQASAPLAGAGPAPAVAWPRAPSSAMFPPRHPHTLATYLAIFRDSSA